MNLKLRRLVRTPSSEQYAIFDLDRTDDAYDPLSVGKIDLHYAGEGVYGTFLMWKGVVKDLPTDQVNLLVEVILQELGEAMGLPSFYAVEFFTPDLKSYVFHTSEDGATQPRPGDEGAGEEADASPPRG
ncbi:MAG: hypothetical protein ACK2UY_02160 [Anaerolineae bacterium]|jgi:hypothetical protein